MRTMESMTESMISTMKNLKVFMDKDKLVGEIREDINIKNEMAADKAYKGAAEMKINGWDISGAQARQWNVTPLFQISKMKANGRGAAHCHFSSTVPSGSKQYRSLSWYMARIGMKSCRTAAPCFPR